MKKILVILLIFCVTMLGFSQSHQQNEIKNTSWQWELTPYLWATGLSGEINFMNRNIPVEAKFKDILKDLKMAAMFHVEVKKGHWAILLDLLYTRLSENGNLFGLQENDFIKGTVKLHIYELGAAYSFIEIDHFLLDVIAGARYFNVTTEIEVIDGPMLLDKKMDFIDPFVGLRFSNYWNKFGIGARIDIGGFGIGSEVSYKYNTYFGYRISKLFELIIAYQAIEPNYKKDQFEYIVANHGVVFGFNFRL